MWQRAVAKLGKHTLIMTTVVRMKLLVTHKSAKKNYIIKNGKRGNCRYPKLDIMCKCGSYFFYFLFFFRYNVPRPSFKFFAP
ncbi:hypothetical protein BAE44_0007244 [Dichanthelium oligosanthes]|uniref:Uncharacterized protein n=1 Tax=Dichanthelium oligosanthes TaxID=888268 RepID=A0A1E5W2Y0_9POAL|nr:hypothetical protein BAE44_0007244 [Dichanthelium oligosanthes]